MRFIFTLLLLTVYIVFAQDSTSCNCSISYTLRYSKKAEENKICGEVVIEMDRDENCNYSNPVVRKGLGYGCDEEALRITRIFINSMNRCNEKCKARKCKPEKHTQKITFECYNDEEK